MSDIRDAECRFRVSGSRDVLHGEPLVYIDVNGEDDHNWCWNMRTETAHKLVAALTKALEDTDE